MTASTPNTVRVSSVSANETWTVSDSRGLAPCETPCEREVPPGTTVTVQRGTETLTLDAPGGNKDIVVNPPRGSTVAPFVIVPVGAVVLTTGLVIATHRRAADCPNVLGGPPCGTNPPDVATGGVIAGLGTAIVAAGVTLWLWSHSSHWLGVRDRFPSSQGTLWSTGDEFGIRF
jgi:hypothetical protein